MWIKRWLGEVKAFVGPFGHSGQEVVALLLLVGPGPAPPVLFIACCGRLIGSLLGARTTGGGGAPGGPDTLSTLVEATLAPPVVDGGRFVDVVGRSIDGVLTRGLADMVRIDGRFAGVGLGLPVAGDFVILMAPCDRNVLG